MMASPVYEFPYSGNRSSSIPLLNYNPNGLSPYNISSLDGLLYNNTSTFTVPDSRQLLSDLGNNTVVYRIPSNMSLNTLLRELGVDMNSLQRSSSYSDYYTNASQPMEFILPPPPTRRRRMICREVSDSDDDDDDDYHRRSSHHRRRHHSSPNEYNQSPGRVHHLLGNSWNKAVNATENPPQGMSMPNTNSQWQGMQNASSPPPPPPPPMSQEHRNAVANVWNQAANASKDKPNFISSFFRRMKPGNTTNDAPSSGPPQNREAAQNFAAARNFPGGTNQPNNAVANVFGAAQRGAPPMQNPSFTSMPRLMPPPPQQPFYSPRPPVASVWNQMAGAAPPPQQPFYSPRPPMNPSGYQPQQGYYSPPGAPYGPPPMGGPQPGYPSPPGAAPRAFAALFSQPRGPAPPYGAPM